MGTRNPGTSSEDEGNPAKFGDKTKDEKRDRGRSKKKNFKTEEGGGSSAWGVDRKSTPVLGPEKTKKFKTKKKWG